MITNKQKKFIDEYFIDCNAKQAAIRAGYSSRSAEFQGCKLLAIPEIAAEIARIRNEMAQKAIITREEILKDLKDIKDEQKKNYAPASLKAIEIINKMQGWNEPDKVQHSGTINLNIPGIDSDNEQEQEETE